MAFYITLDAKTKASIAYALHPYCIFSSVSLASVCWRAWLEANEVQSGLRKFFF